MSALSTRTKYGVVRCAVLALLAQFCGAAGAAEGRTTDVDVALVLAVDISMSMTPAELALQRDGYVSAFRSPELLRAVSSGSVGRISVTLVEWGGPLSQSVVIPWTTVATREDLESFAAQLSKETPTRSYYSAAGMSTSISSLLVFSAFLLDSQKDVRAARQVIDVSGDGPNNAGQRVDEARDAVIARGITINGLAIDLPRVVQAGTAPRLQNTLKVYFERCVIGGPSAFAVGIEDMAQIGPALRRKLVNEIVARGSLYIPTSAAEGPLSMLDCGLPGQMPGR